jgi:hypothetical protein
MKKVFRRKKATRCWFFFASRVVKASAFVAILMEATRKRNQARDKAHFVIYLPCYLIVVCVDNSIIILLAMASIMK